MTPDHVPIPGAVSEALKAGDRFDAFQDLPAPQRWRLLFPVEAAGRPETGHAASAICSTLSSR